MAETINGLYGAEVIHRLQEPWRSFLGRRARYSTGMGRLVHQPAAYWSPSERHPAVTANPRSRHYAMLEQSDMAADSNKMASATPGAVHPPDAHRVVCF